MYPGDILPAVSGASPETAFHHRKKRIEHAATVRTQGHRRAHKDFACVGRGGLVEFTFPCGRHINAETPSVGGVRLRTAQEAGRFVIGRIVAMSVYGRRAGLKPYAGRAGRPSDRVP